MTDDAITVGAAWSEPEPHMLDLLAGIHAGLQFAEREALYDVLAARGVYLDRARFRRIFALYRLHDAARERYLTTPFFGLRHLERP